MIHRHTLTFTRDGESISKAVDVTVEGEQHYDLPIAGGATNIQFAVAFDKDALLSVYLVSDQDVTLKTNSTGSPGDTIVLKANKPVQWYLASQRPIPFAADVTTLYGTNAGVAAAAVKIRLGFDSTP